MAVTLQDEEAPIVVYVVPAIVATVLLASILCILLIVYIVRVHLPRHRKGTYDTGNHPPDIVYYNGSVHIYAEIEDNRSQDEEHNYY